MKNKNLLKKEKNGTKFCYYKHHVLPNKSKSQKSKTTFVFWDYDMIMDFVQYEISEHAVANNLKLASMRKLTNRRRATGYPK